MCLADKNPTRPLAQIVAMLKIALAMENSEANCFTFLDCWIVGLRGGQF